MMKPNFSGFLPSFISLIIKKTHAEEEEKNTKSK
jgi:hypothetical protein